MKGKSVLFLIGLVMGTALAGIAQKSSERRFFKTDDALFQREGIEGKSVTAPFSDAVLVGDTMYLAGRTGVDPKTGAVPQDVQQEIRFVLNSFKATLAKGGMTMDDVVMVQIFCPDLSLYSKFNAIYRSSFPKDLPPRAFVGSGPILGGAHFEMMGIAVRR